jgi:hypothetical protein
MNIGQNHLSSATLCRQFNTMEWNTDETLQSWISYIEEYRNQLKGTDHAINDVDLIMTLLMGVLTEWSMIMRKYLQSPKGAADMGLHSSRIAIEGTPYQGQQTNNVIWYGSVCSRPWQLLWTW